MPGNTLKSAFATGLIVIGGVVGVATAIAIGCDQADVMRRQRDDRAEVVKDFVGGLKNSPFTYVDYDRATRSLKVLSKSGYPGVELLCADISVLLEASGEHVLDASDKVIGKRVSDQGIVAIAGVVSQWVERPHQPRNMLRLLDDIGYGTRVHRLDYAVSEDAGEDVAAETDHKEVITCQQ